METSQLTGFRRIASMGFNGLNICFLFNRFTTNVPLLCPLKISENLWFSDIFREYRSGTFVENELMIKYQNESFTPFTALTRYWTSAAIV